jgi:hypothetical protein
VLTPSATATYVEPLADTSTQDIIDALRIIGRGTHGQVLVEIARAYADRWNLPVDQVAVPWSGTPAYRTTRALMRQMSTDGVLSTHAHRHRTTPVYRITGA